MLGFVFGRMWVHVHTADGIFHEVNRAGVLWVIGGNEPAVLIVAALGLVRHAMEVCHGSLQGPQCGWPGTHD